MRVTVLGASGFIGSALVAQLTSQRVQVRAVSRGTADLTDPDALAAAVSGSDAIVHLVVHRNEKGDWRADEKAARVNVDTVRNLVRVYEERPERPVVLFAGSITQVGCSGPRIDGSEPDRPATEYDRQKHQGELILKDATARGVLDACILRLPTVFSDRADAPGVVSAMVRRALAGQPLTLWNDGTVVRDLVHVDDIARAFVSALEHAKDLAGRHWVLGSGRGVPLRRLFELIADTVAACTRQPAVPVTTVPAPIHAGATDFHGHVVDASAFTAVTGWRPEISLTEGIRRMAVSG